MIVYAALIMALLVTITQLQIQSNKKKIKKANQKIGGMRFAYPFVIDYLENNMQMTLVFDTGTDFSYRKKLYQNDIYLGNLTIGLKIEGNLQEVLYSQLVDTSNKKYLGLSIATSNLNSNEFVEEKVNSSTKSIFENFPFDKTKIEDDVNDWELVLKKLAATEQTSLLRKMIKYLFIPYNIGLTKYLENYDILDNTWKALQNRNYGTSSIRGVYFFRFYFVKEFVSAFPDVYKLFLIECDLGENIIMNKIKIDTAISKQYLDKNGWTIKAMKEMVENHYTKYKKLELQKQ